MKDAKTVGRRAMKYLYHSMAEAENQSCAIEEYIDTAIGSPNLLLRYLKHIIENLELKASAVLAYLRAISDLTDYRKSRGCTDNVLRAFTVTEVYLRKCKTTMQRRKNMEYTRDLDLETLVNRNSWATLEEVRLCHLIFDVISFSSYFSIWAKLVNLSQLSQIIGPLKSIDLNKSS